MSFFDEGDEPGTQVRTPRQQPRRPQPRGRRQAIDDRTLLVRRGAAAAIILVVLIALVLVIKTVLDHQAVAGLRTYDDNVNRVVDGESGAVVLPVFREIDNAFNSSNPIDVPTALQQYVSQEQSDYRTVEGWSVPAQMVGAQRWLVEAFGLRYEALNGIATEMKNALAVGAGQATAIRHIAGEMEKLLSADVIYRDRVQPLIADALAKANVTDAVSASQFLPDIGWLQPENVANRILGYVPTSLGGPPVTGSPGHELVAVGVQTGPTTVVPLSAGGITKLPYTTAGITFVLTVLNSGTLKEHEIQTDIHFYKAGQNTSCLKSTATIPLTVPGTSYQSSILFAPATCGVNLPTYFNEGLLMTAEVQTLPGETDTANNKKTFDIEFTR
ncbi:MAG TPA: hypothetical protein VKS25_02800 [Solirubrobacteraceae bacterium]|nr:hypothetical protein [Solirubrobacteraceae bacterium]